MAEALGSMSHLMANDKLEEQLPKLIPTIISLYKKNPEHYVISKVGLVLRLYVAIFILEKHLTLHIYFQFHSACEVAFMFLVHTWYLFQTLDFCLV